jgi:NADPH-dependent 2,4-dienoyl-CoA reductase/sulfur reductase-like enzyme
MSEPLTRDDHVVVVGAGLAGWRCSEALRREGFTGALTMIGGEAHTPYDRPPLSKQVLSGAWSEDKTTLVTAERIGELNITTRLGVNAVHLDAALARVELDDGSVVEGTRVVVATGCRARRLSVSAMDHLHTLRTRDDARRLIEAAEILAPRSTVVIIGGGFIGAEVATSLHARGLRPIVLEALSMPLVTVLGESAATWLRGLSAPAGVELRTSQQVDDVVRSPAGFEVQLADGSRIEAALVVLGVGAEPNTEWLERSGLELRHGVVTNDRLEAAERVGAIGDVARFTWRHGPFVDDVRIEHWQTANDHAYAYAHVLVAGSDAAGPLTMTPYFWSDQLGKKIQMLGHPAPSDDIVRVAGSPEEGRWLALYSRDDVVTGLLSLSNPRALMVSKSLVDDHVTREEALARAPWAT